MRIIIAILLTISATTAMAEDRDVHAMMDSKWWITAGPFLAEREFKASAKGSGGGVEREFDFEESLGLADSDELGQGELGWNFSTNWTVALQYFRATRSRSTTLDETLEWQGNTYDVGAMVSAKTTTEITRIFFARDFRSSGHHSLRLGAGLHWLKLSGEIAGQATLDDMSTEFRRSTAKAEFPIPNIGAWYRYSPGKRWLINARVDWLSASIDSYSGGIWNASAGLGFAFTDHFGIGANYQFFQISGDVKEDQWKGEIKATFSGPFVYLSGYW